MRTAYRAVAAIAAVMVTVPLAAGCGKARGPSALAPHAPPNPYLSAPTYGIGGAFRAHLGG